MQKNLWVFGLWSNVEQCEFLSLQYLGPTNLEKFSFLFKYGDWGIWKIA